jgi:hypothetical protein
VIKVQAFGGIPFGIFLGQMENMGLQSLCQNLTTCWEFKKMQRLAEKQANQDMC